MPNHLGLTDKWDVPSCGGSAYDDMKYSIELYNSAIKSYKERFMKLGREDFIRWVDERDGLRFNKWFFEYGKPYM